MLQPPRRPRHAVAVLFDMRYLLPRVSIEAQRCSKRCLRFNGQSIILRALKDTYKREQFEFSMTRLPEPGKDIGTWGGILNDFLKTAHNPDGSLKSSALRILDGSITTPQLADNAVTDSKLDVATQTTLATVASKYTKPAGGVPLTDLSSSLRANLTKADASVQQVNNKTPDGSGALTLTAADVGAATSLGGLSDVNATGATNSQVL